MADVPDTPDGEVLPGGEAPLTAPAEAQALDAVDAQASLDDLSDGATAAAGNVVAVAFGAKRLAVSLSDSDVVGSSSPTPPTPQESANAHLEGTGGVEEGGRKPKVEKKKEKTIDWGKYNHLIEHFALIYGTDTVWDGAERIIMKIANMGHAHSSEMVRMWKGSDRRRTVRQEDVVFDPTETCSERCINLYDGMAMEPKAGDVQPALQLVRFLTSRVSDDSQEADDIMNWLLCWIAYPLQNPGAKLRTAVVMHGDEGAGKNFLFDMVVAIYGKYGVLVGQDELEDKFNDWRSCKLFVVGDEVSSRAELVHNKNRLKALITSPTVQINPKNLPRREESNHMNVAFLSNELQPLALDNSDRRYLVVYTPRKKDFEYYRALAKWRDNGGLEAFYAFLMTYKLDRFDPYSPAQRTNAKADLISLNLKSPERFWLEWSSGELDLPYHSCSMPQAYAAYLKYAQRTGDRFPVQRPVFTPMVLRFSESQEMPARVKVMKLDKEGNKKAERMFLVCDPPSDRKEGEWATETVDQFTDHLKTYLSAWSPTPHGGGDGQKDGA